MLNLFFVLSFRLILQICTLMIDKTYCSYYRLYYSGTQDENQIYLEIRNSCLKETELVKEEVNQ